MCQKNKNDGCMLKCISFCKFVSKQRIKKKYLKRNAMAMNIDDDDDDDDEKHWK